MDSDTLDTLKHMRDMLDSILLKAEESRIKQIAAESGAKVGEVKPAFPIHRTKVGLP